MSVVSGVVVYFLVWWVVIFAILPMGNEPIEESTSEGIAGAPKVSNIKKKFLIASVVAAVIWGGVFILVEIELFDFREIARRMARGV